MKMKTPAALAGQLVCRAKEDAETPKNEPHEPEHPRYVAIANMWYWINV